VKKGKAIISHGCTQINTDKFSGKTIEKTPVHPHTSAAKLFFLLGICLGAVGCGTDRYEVQNPGYQASPEEAIRDAETYLNTRPNWKIDCSHFVLACYHSPAMDRFFGHYSYLNHNRTKDLRIYLEQNGTRRARAADIQPGDILIFNKTYDKNNDGHIDERDTDTHTGIVESFNDMRVTFIDASEGRKPPRLHRRQFSFYDSGPNPHVARDPATGRRIRLRETFYAAYGPPSR